MQPPIAQSFEAIGSKCRFFDPSTLFRINGLIMCTLWIIITVCSHLVIASFLLCWSCCIRLLHPELLQGYRLSIDLQIETLLRFFIDYLDLSIWSRGFVQICGNFIISRRCWINWIGLFRRASDQCLSQGCMCVVFINVQEALSIGSNNNCAADIERRIVLWTEATSKRTLHYRLVFKKVLVLGGEVDVGGSRGEFLSLAQELRLTLFWESHCLTWTVLVHEGLRRR